jgi:hypothetical protein
MAAQTFTITFGDQAENHVGMQKIGQLSQTGFTLEDLNRAKACFEQNGIQCSLINLKTLLPDEVIANAEDAYILIAHQGLNCMIKPYNSDHFFQEQAALEKDTQAFMYGRVVNKHARYNLCFGSQDQEPDYTQGKGRIVAFHKLPLLNHVRQILPLVIGEKGENLVAEGNYYYDITKCGIGFHGDSERRKVVGIRVGATLPLHYQWFYQSKPIGKRGEILLNHGDVYFMSEKAVGNDWKKKNILTLRHAAGAPKYLTIK